MSERKGLPRFHWYWPEGFLDVLFPSWQVTLFLRPSMWHFGFYREPWTDMAEAHLSLGPLYIAWDCEGENVRA